jgi:hypothetical protein
MTDVEGSRAVGRIIPVAAERPVWPGTAGPARSTPRRRPGSVRRTSTVDIMFPPGTSTLLLRGAGRDLLTPTVGEPRVLGNAATEVTVELATRAVTSLVVEPARWQGAADRLVGEPAGSRFRSALEEQAPELIDAGSLLGLLLDEVPVVMLIAGSSLARRGLIPMDAQTRRMPLVDVCAGWAAGGVMVQAIMDGDTPFLGEGPAVEGLDAGDDPLAWHAVDPLPPGSMRRWRRLDLLPPAEHGGPVAVDVLFRDSYVEDDGGLSAVHEYGIEATIHIHETGRATIEQVVAVPHALPGPECRLAAASATRLIGMALDEVRRHVRQEFNGTSTCTHLNDALRSVGDLGSLLPAVGSTR